jgi:hypothetical protein
MTSVRASPHRYKPAAERSNLMLADAFGDY